MLLQARAAETLRGWVAPDAEQEALRLGYLEHLGTHPDGWSRACRGAHLTASTLVCAPAEQQVLLTLHARIGRWLQTGGHLEAADFDLEAAALREATEESSVAGLRLDPTPVLLSRHEVACGPLRPTFHLDVQYLVHAACASAPTVGPESHDVQWFRFDQLPDVDDSVRALVTAARIRLCS